MFFLGKSSQWASADLAILCHVVFFELQSPLTTMYWSEYWAWLSLEGHRLCVNSHFLKNNNFVQHSAGGGSPGRLQHSCFWGQLSRLYYFSPFLFAQPDHRGLFLLIILTYLHQEELSHAPKKISFFSHLDKLSLFLFHSPSDHALIAGTLI